MRWGTCGSANRRAGLNWGAHADAICRRRIARAGLLILFRCNLCSLLTRRSLVCRGMYSPPLGHMQPCSKDSTTGSTSPRRTRAVAVVGNWPRRIVDWRNPRGARNGDCTRTRISCGPQVGCGRPPDNRDFNLPAISVSFGSRKDSISMYAPCRCCLKTSDVPLMSNESPGFWGDPDELLSATSLRRFPARATKFLSSASMHFGSAQPI